MLSVSPAFSEPAATGNVLPNLSEFSTSGSTTSSSTSGCTAGEFCTGNASNGGGTYTSSFDVPLTAAEVRQGFTLNSAVTVDSHPSNAVLATCTSLTQIGDCRDVFRLTISLFDGLDLAEKFEREIELDFGGLQNFTFPDTVAANSFDILLGEFSLFGIDAGFQSGFFGPKFSNPDLTISYQTVIEQQILDQITQTTEIVTATIAPPPPPSVETAPTSQTAGPPPPATMTVTMEMQAPAPPPPPTIEPIAPPPTEAQIAEANVEAEIQTEIQDSVESESTPSESAGAAPVPAVAATSNEEEPPASSAPREQAVERRPLTRREKVKAAAQKIVKKIAPSQRYSAASQTTTLVVMNLISARVVTDLVIQDKAAATFFVASTVPDGPSMVDPMTNYRLFGRANGAHSALGESQWSR